LDLDSGSKISTVTREDAEQRLADAEAVGVVHQRADDSGPKISTSPANLDLEEVPSPRGRE
jgi:hypothetical protein